MINLSRRSFFSSSGIGLGSVALNLLLARDLQAKDSPEKYRGLAGFPHHKPKVKRVIFLYMSGGPSHLETFDFKPKLAELDGKPMPESFTKGQPIAQLQGQALKAQGPLTKFKQHGKSRTVDQRLPAVPREDRRRHLHHQVDGDRPDQPRSGPHVDEHRHGDQRPAVDGFVDDLRTRQRIDELPGFVVMTSDGGRNPQPISPRMWGNGFLPGRFQGVEFNSSGDPVYYVRNPKGVSDEQQHDLVDAVKELDRHRNATQKNPEVDTRIAAYEMAFSYRTVLSTRKD